MQPTNSRKAVLSLGRRRRASLCLACLFLTAQLVAQMTVTGAITGTVVDASGRAVPGAKVTLTSEKTRELRAASTNELGAFSFVAVPPDTYAIKAEHSGFKIFQRTGLVVSANERIALGDVGLQVGAVSETVTVTAQAAHGDDDS